MVRRGPRWNELWSLHSWSSRRLARHWPRWQIARGPRCGAALHFRRNAAIGPLARSLLDRSSGPFSFRRRSRHGPSGPRRKCGVRRREPLCGATGVYEIKRAPAALCAVGNKREWGAESASPLGRKKCALRAQRKIRAASRQKNGAAHAAITKNPPFGGFFRIFLKKYYKMYFSL